MFPTESQCFPFCSLFSRWKRTKHTELYQGCKQAGAPRKSCSDQVVGNDESRVAGGIFVVEFEDDFNIRLGAGDPSVCLRRATGSPCYVRNTVVRASSNVPTIRSFVEGLTSSLEEAAESSPWGHIRELRAQEVPQLRLPMDD
ncbi:hypothetical protein J6590_094339 [Homalodisca vitripennis]|nr:hypothetical protein J6590_094339 [Homalodisca vitripennis]